MRVIPFIQLFLGQRRAMKSEYRPTQPSVRACVRVRAFAVLTLLGHKIIRVDVVVVVRRKNIACQLFRQRVHDGPSSLVPERAKFASGECNDHVVPQWKCKPVFAVAYRSCL